MPLLAGGADAAIMKIIAKVFAPPRNRRLNELVGFLVGVSALLLFLALSSYSPLDPSLNSASLLTTSHAARNWIGILGAFVADIFLQFWGVGSFLLPLFMGLLGMRWFRSRPVQNPVAKTLGAIWLLLFLPALLAILPGHVRWMGAIPIEGLAGRILGDVLIRYLNVAGAYIVCTTVLAVALYFTTAFSFAAIQVWAPTRFAFVVALRDSWQDWQHEAELRRQQKELDKRRAVKPNVTAQLVPGRPQVSRSEASSADLLRQQARHNESEIQPASPEKRTGIERMMSEEREEQNEPSMPPSEGSNGISHIAV